MRRRALLVLTLALALATPLALAQENGSNETGPANETDDAPPDTPTQSEPGAVAFTLLGFAEGGEFWWEDEEGNRNPTLRVPAGAEVTITARSVSGFHNVHVEGFGPSDYFSDGEETTYTFTAPASGTLPYWCDPHRSAGMAGRVVVEGSGDGTGDGGGGFQGESPEVNGPAVDLGDLGYPECAGYMIPRATADDAVGGPSVSDYVELCRSGGEAVQTERASHPADYAIPLSFVLIVLGVAGVAWVHRKYQP